MSDPSQNPQHHITNQTVQGYAYVGAMAGRDIIGNVTINNGPDHTQVLNACLHKDYSFFQSRLDRFVGREQELAEIRQRIAELLPTGGYVTIMGQAGQGKSCVIAKLVHDHLLQVAAAQGKELSSNPSFDQLIDKVGHEQVIFHAIPLDPGADYQVSLLRNLIARLCLKYGLSEIYAASDSRPALRDYFASVLRDIAQQGKQELIYIDGLDQILPESDGKRDLSFLPLEPPPGIVFVLGTRPDDTLQPLELRKPREPYLLPALSRDDFELILQRYQVNLATVNIQRFYDAMDRNALYLDLVAQELHAYEGCLTPETIEALIERIGSDPSQIFKLTIERLSQQDRYWDNILMPLLGYLLVAKSPLSAGTLRKLIACNLNTLQTGLRLLGGLLTTTSDQHYTLYHLKLRDYLKEHFFAADEQREFHKCLADWAWQGKGGLEAIWQDQKDGLEQERRVYAREHLITQLADAQDYDRLWELIDIGDYGRAKLRFDPSTRSYALDLDYARQAIIDIDGTLDEQLQLLPRFWRYSLLRTRLASRADAYPDELYQAMVRQGRVQEVIGLLELLNDQKRKIRLFVELSTLINDCDDIVQKMRNRALQIWYNFDYQQREDSINRWFHIHSDLREKHNVLIPLLLETYIQNDMNDKSTQGFLYNRCCQLIADYYYLVKPNKEKEKQYFEVILDLNQNCLDTKSVDHKNIIKLKLLLTRSKEPEMLEKAQKLLHSLPYHEQPPWAIRSIISTYLDLDNINQALNYASSLDDEIQSAALQLIVEGFIRTGKIKQAIKLAFSIPSKIYRLETKYLIIKSLAQAGRFKQAIKLTLLMRESNAQTRAKLVVIEALARVGKIARAQSFTASISDEIYQSWAKRTIVEALARTGEIEQALLLAISIPNKEQQLFSINIITTILVREGRIEDVERIISIVDETLQSEAKTNIIQSLVDIGMVDQAYTLLTSIAREDQFLAKSILTNAFIQTGRIDQARQIISLTRSHDEWLRSFIELTIVRGLISSGKTYEGQKLAHSIRDESLQLEALNEIASPLQYRKTEQESKSILVVDQLLKEEIIEEVYTFLTSISNNEDGPSQGMSILKILADTGKWLTFIKIIQNSWLQSRDYNDLCKKFLPCLFLVIYFPELGMQLAESFDWVESALV